MLTIRCCIHPAYKATKKPDNDCEICKLLFVLVHQEKNNQEKLLEEVESKLTVIGGGDWGHILECMETGEKSKLIIRCRHHHYQAMRKPGWYCDTCWLLFVLKYQMHKEGEKRLGPFNPYAYVIGHVDLKNACADLRVIKV